MITIKYSEILQNQPTFNIGCIGSVSEGKSTIVRQISKTEPHRHQKERQGNSTVNLGYANFKIWRDPETGRLETTTGEVNNFRGGHSKGNDWILTRHLAFVDCPGHANFMTTMMSGTGVMDGVFLLIGANNHEVPLAQTREHMNILERTDISKILVLQNKIDLLSSAEQALGNRGDIRKFLETSRARDSRVIPISAQLKINLEPVLQYLVDDYQSSEIRVNMKLDLPIIRSFDVNKPGTKINQIKGAVIGGSISKGFLRTGELIEIRPGICRKSVWTPLISRVTSLFVGQRSVDYAVPGGLIGVGLSIDPFWAVGNKLVGQTVGRPGMMSKVYDQLKIQIDTYLIPDLHFLNFSMGETVLVTTGNSVVKATFSYQLKTNLALLSLSQPLCLSLKTKVAISKKDNIKQSFQLAFIGTFVKGVQCKNFRLPDNYEEIVSGISQPEITIDYELNEVEKTSEAEQIKEIPDKVGDGEVVGDGDGEVVGESEYAILLKNFNFEKVSSIFKIPPPQVHREAKKTTIANIETILRSIYCFKGQNWIENSERLRKFLTSELISKQVRYTGDGQLLIDGIFQSKQIENLLHRYLTKYVICQTCSSPNTVLNRNNVQCQNCGVNHFLE